MQINQSMLAQFENSHSQLLVVSKYFSVAQTATIIDQLAEKQYIIGFGENRVTSLLDKKIDRNLCHFIGNIQSKDIPGIAAHCSVVHSLCSLKHAQCFMQQSLVPRCFVQVNISGETQKGGVDIHEVLDFLSALPDGFPLGGISAIGSYTDDPAVKTQEFLTLIALRDHLRQQKNSWNHLDVKNWKISAGTSIDYQLALSHGIDVIRVGRALFSN